MRQVSHCTITVILEQEHFQSFPETTVATHVQAVIAVFVLMLTVILHRFPATDRSAFALPSGVGMFCLPMGASLERWPLGARHPLPVFSTFVLTSDVGLKIYGAAIVFYDDFDASQLSVEQLQLSGLAATREGEYCDWMVHQNRSICFLSRWPFYEAMRGLLLYIYRISVSGPQPIPLERCVSFFSAASCLGQSFRNIVTSYRCQNEGF